MPRGGSNFIDETGNRYGRLVVISREENKIRKQGKPNAMWLCACDCGQNALVSGTSLRRGETRSCGCLRRESMASAGHKNGKAPGVAAFNGLYARYEIQAKRRGYLFELSREEFANIVAQPCFYCGAPPSNVAPSKTTSLTYSGVDRVDVTKGYTTRNCVPCCGDCNYQKSTVTPRIIRLAYGFLNAD